MPWVMTLVSLLIRIDIQCSLLDRSNDLGGGFGHGIGRDNRQARILEDLLAHVFVGALHADNQRYRQVHFLGSGNHAGGDGVALHDAAEDVDQNTLDLRVLEHDLEGFGDFLGRGTATDIEEVGRLGAEQLDGVHGGHGQTGTVDQTADVAVEGDVGQVELRGFDFIRIFFIQIAESDDFFLTVQGVRVKVELGIQRLDVAVAFEDQRIDFSQRGIRFHVAAVKLLEGIDGLGLRTGRDTNAVSQGLGLRVGHANERVDENLDDFFRCLVSDFFDVHTTFARCHHGNALGSAIGQRSHVIFVLDVSAFFDQQVTNLLAFRASLVRDELHAENVVSVLTHFVERLGDFNATALAATTCVNLGFNDPNVTAEGFRCLDCVINAGAVDTARNADAEFLQDLFALIFVNFHALSLPIMVTNIERITPPPARLRTYRTEFAETTLQQPSGTERNDGFGFDDSSTQRTKRTS